MHTGRRPLHSLENIWYHLIRHLAAVLVPVLAIFLAALGVVTKRAMDQQPAQLQWVDVREYVVEKSWKRPQESQCQFGHIVEMAGKAPVTGNQQKTGSCLTIRQLILSSDHLRRITPDQALSIRLADLEFLAVRSIVDHAADDPGCEDKNGPEEAELDCP